MTKLTQKDLTLDILKQFDEDRLEITVQFALFASSDVFDMYSELIDYTYNTIENNTFDFHVFRVKTLSFLSEVRRDIGIYKDEITYKGNR